MHFQGAYFSLSHLGLFGMLLYSTFRRHLGRNTAKTISSQQKAETKHICGRLRTNEISRSARDFSLSHSLNRRISFTDRRSRARKHGLGLKPRAFNGERAAGAASSGPAALEGSRNDASPGWSWSSGD